ncbi:hypothetical protein N7532_007805 [Penicillium argentinense]|uniref:Uncharacterized protein n=1 Tax=Penicillium argentinense TaxID=1131581 RepID=A0A9W9EWE7_9EURO|nr:uncharacterized protein N7532_007805 [Penicillium argentinense]KAJ5089121.1 hypothetical protein N7532_007805 [Penicillium argentinense]
MAQTAMGRLFRWPSTIGQSVTFSQVRSYSAVPTFAPTSSAELDQALGRFRQQLFIPYGLPRRQRRSMFQEKHAQRLIHEPITVSINENEQFTLRPMKLSELPTKKEALQVLKLMEANNDFKNLVPFMSGLGMSNFVISSDQWEHLMRVTNKFNKLSLILQCAKQQNQTGLQLRDVDLNRRLFFELHTMAQKAEFKGEAVKKALGLAKQAIDLVEAEHYVDEHWKPSLFNDPLRQPFVIGTLLELSAARAVSEFAGKDETNEVINNVRKLICSKLLFKHEKAPADESVATGEKWLQETVPVYNSLRLSLLVHGVATDKQLHSSITSHLNQVKAALEEQMAKYSAEGAKRPFSYDTFQAVLKL